MNSRPVSGDGQYRPAVQNWRRRPGCGTGFARWCVVGRSQDEVSRGCSDREVGTELLSMFPVLVETQRTPRFNTPRPLRLYVSRLQRAAKRVAEDPRKLLVFKCQTVVSAFESTTDSGDEPKTEQPERVQRLRSDRRDRQQGGDARTPESHRVLPARRDRHERRSGQSGPCRHHLPVLKESAVTEPGSPPRAAMRWPKRRESACRPNAAARKLSDITMPVRVLLGDAGHGPGCEVSAMQLHGASLEKLVRDVQNSPDPIERRSLWVARLVRQITIDCSLEFSAGFGGRSISLSRFAGDRRTSMRGDAPCKSS